MCQCHTVSYEWFCTKTCFTGMASQVFFFLKWVAYGVQQSQLMFSDESVKPTRPNGLGISEFANICRGNLQVCIFACEVLFSPLMRPFLVASLSLLQDFQFEKFF